MQTEPPPEFLTQQSRGRARDAAEAACPQTTPSWRGERARLARGCSPVPSTQPARRDYLAPGKYLLNA